MILIIDNYDSFVHNLARYVRLEKQDTLVVRNDSISIEEIGALKPSGIIISPGPCTPDDAGISLALIKAFYKHFPILGVCLGHQAIVQSFGGIVRRGDPVHGRQSILEHDNSLMFTNIPQHTKVGRYHSLVCELGTQSDLIQSAQTLDGVNMAVRHKNYPVFGVQFHPESILTEHGSVYIKNFLKVCP